MVCGQSSGLNSTYPFLTSKEYAEWWEPEPVWKMHYQVPLEDGRELGIFRTCKTGNWYRAEAGATG